jgi:hypothetical protein
MLEVFLHLIYNQRCRLYNTMNDSKTLEFLRYKLGLRNSKYNICASLFFFFVYRVLAWYSEKLS